MEKSINEKTKESMVIYRSFYEALQDIPTEQRLAVYEAIFDFGFNFKEPQHLKGVQSVVWKLVKPQLVANIKRYENSLQRRKKQKDARENKKTKASKN